MVYIAPLLLLSFLITAPAFADPWSLQINAVSHHPSRDDLNERNAGVGLQYTATGERFVTRYAAGTITNSMSDRTWYAGAAVGPRLGSRDLYVNPSVFVGVLTYPSSGRALIPALLPVLTLGSGGVALNAIYIPQVGDKTAEAVLFQFTLQLP